MTRRLHPVLFVLTCCGALVALALVLALATVPAMLLAPAILGYPGASLVVVVTVILWLGRKK